jgi:membrane protease YdiL (CAAX protease family)
MSKKTLGIKDSCLSFVSAFILAQLAVVLFVLILSVLFNVFKLDISVEVFTNTAVGYLICTIILNLTLLFVFLYFQKNSNNKIYKKPTLKKLCLYITIGALAFFTLSPIVTCVDTLLFNLNFRQNTIPYSLTTANYTISIFSLALLPAIFEELLFRGLIFKGLKPHGKRFAIIISATPGFSVSLL